MRLLWKIATPVLYAGVIGGLAFLWSMHQAKAKLVAAAQACRVRAEQGDAKSEYDLSHMYHYGQGVPQDYAETLRWCQKAADQGLAKAEYGVGYIYQHGQGVPQNDAEAARWYRMAADQGNGHAQDEIGYLYQTGHGVSQDYAQAAQWYRKAADQGSPYAQNQLGLLYYRGQGVPKDDAESARWYRKGADQGYALAESGIGFMLYYGHGVLQDRAEAHRWFLKAANQGDDYALRTLSERLTGGRQFTLFARSIVGLWLAFSFLSLNSFDSGAGLRESRQRVKAWTGVLLLLTAGFSWYGYTHYTAQRFYHGLNVFTWTKWLLDGICGVLLAYLVRSAKGPGAQGREIKEDLIDGVSGEVRGYSYESSASYRKEL
jgi:TPR repeat protein